MGKIDSLIKEVESGLSQFKVNHSGLDWRQKVLLLVAVNKKIKGLGKSINPFAADLKARERLKLYFLQYVGVVIDSKELEVVSGISEYARRVRELRVQDGYKILTGSSNDPELGVELKRFEYILLEKEPDHSAARRWHIANRIRKEKTGGSSGRILHFLKENVGQIITSEEIAYVAKASEYGRRIRELRTEKGFSISTQFTGRPDLKMGEYILESTERVSEPHDRKIPFDVQKSVYERDRNTCLSCGWTHDKWTKRDPRILELHHVKEHVRGGKNTVNNLILLCSKCHDKIHAKKIKLPKAFRE